MEDKKVIFSVFWASSYPIIKKLNTPIIIVKFHLVTLSNYHFCMTNASDTLEIIQVALPSRKSKISKNLIFYVFGVGA